LPSSNRVELRRWISSVFAHRLKRLIVRTEQSHIHVPPGPITGAPVTGVDNVREKICLVDVARQSTQFITEKRLRWQRTQWRTGWYVAVYVRKHR